MGAARLVRVRARASARVRVRVRASVRVRVSRALATSVAVKLPSASALPDVKLPDVKLPDSRRPAAAAFANRELRLVGAADCEVGGEGTSSSASSEVSVSSLAMALSTRLPTRAMLAASESLCVLVTMMLGAKSLRKRMVEGATRGGPPQALRLRSVLLPF